VPKGDYNVVLRPYRLRLLLDQRPLNVYLSPPRFRNEGLHTFRELLEPSDVLLAWNFSTFFW
jgi:hypothetical protein